MKKVLTKENIAKALFFLFFFSLPFGTKKFLFSFAEGEANELSSAFFFLGNLWLILLFIFFAVFGTKPDKKINFGVMAPVAFIVLIFSSGASLFTAISFSSGIYSLFQIVATALTAVLVVALPIKKKAFVASLTIFLSGVFQSLIGIYQFASGHSLGFKILGEAIVSDTAREMAHVSIGGAEFLRAFGTMPHANILAAFLLLSLLSAFFLFMYKDGGKFLRHISTAGIFLIMVGIAVTFSRSGWISSIVATLAFFAFSIIKTKERKKILALFSAVSISFVALIIIFGWAIFPRASFAKHEPSVDLRLIYMRMGSEILFSNPVLGVGVGNEIIYAKQFDLYSKYGVLKESDFQPTHNLYILSGAETGFLGMTALLFLCASLFFRRRFGNGNIWLISAFCGFLVFGLFDHFFWTLENGKLMFWVLASLIVQIPPDLSENS